MLFRSVNGLESKVDLKNCPIGESTSTVWFSLDRDAMNRVVEEEYPGDKIGLPVRTIDEILSEHPHSNRPMIWKVDVEGFESKVLQGAEASLRKAQVMAVLLEANQPEITKKMEGFGFQLADYDPWLRQVIPVTDGQAQRSTSNYLWIRDYRRISERCQSAGMVEVLGERF